MKEDKSGSSAATRTALVGHTAWQWPQLRDRAPVTHAFFPFMVMVSDGQTATQRPHPLQRVSSIVVVTLLSIIATPT